MGSGSDERRVRRHASRLTLPAERFYSGFWAAVEEYSCSAPEDIGVSFRGTQGSQHGRGAWGAGAGGPEKSADFPVTELRVCFLRLVVTLDGESELVL